MPQHAECRGLGNISGQFSCIDLGHRQPPHADTTQPTSGPVRREVNIGLKGELLMNQRRRLVVIPSISALAVTSWLLLIPPAAAAVDDCRTTSSASDFNGDGYDDAAVGDPYATVDGKPEAGRVTVLLGDQDGRIGEGERVIITQATFGESPEAGDHFGFDVALAPTGHNSGCASLLVGSPGEDVDGHADAGTAHLISDLPNREGTPDMDVSTLTQADAKGSAETGDQFGSSVAITGINQEDRRRLIIGAPGEDIGSAVDAGSVSVFEVDGVPEGLAELRQGQRGPLGAIRLPGTPQTGDRFGTSVATGLVDVAEWSGQGVAHGLVIGAPGDTVSGHDAAGSVTVLSEKFESASLITQDTAGVPGTAEAGDGFGFSVALNARTSVQPATLAVGAPGEDAGRLANTGSVTLFTNSSERFVARTALSQATQGVPGTNEPEDRFGSSLSFGHHASTLLVGVPTEDVGSVVDAGAVQPVKVGGPQSPLRFLPVILESAAGTNGPIAAGDQFGRSLSAMSGQHEDILTISSVYAGTGAVYVMSDASLIAPRSWVATSGAKRFGWSATN
jgi:hypothetical protein